MIPATLPKTDHWLGDLWRDGYRKFGPMVDSITGEPPAAPCLYCIVRFTDQHGVVGWELHSVAGAGHGLITIIDAENYEFALPEQSLPLAVGTWDWEFKTYTTADHSDDPLTWFISAVVIKQKG